MADNTIGGGSLGSLATQVPGQSQNPSQDVAQTALTAPGTLSSYYQGELGSAGVDASGRGYFQAGNPGVPPSESLATSAGAQRAGLVGGNPLAAGTVPGTPNVNASGVAQGPGAPGGEGGAAPAAPVPGQTPPPTGLAPSGTLTPGPGQQGAAAGAESLAASTGQTGAAPPPAAPAPNAAPNTTVGPNGQFQPPAGWTTGQPGPDGLVVITSPDGASSYQMNPATGSLVPYTPPALPATQSPGAPAPSTVPPPPMGAAPAALGTPTPAAPTPAGTPPNVQATLAPPVLPQAPLPGALIPETPSGGGSAGDGGGSGSGDGGGSGGGDAP